MINAIAGGGTLVSFPTMTAIGVPTVQANATNTVALCPGYVGGTWAQRHELGHPGQVTGSRLVVAALGGLTGSILLVLTSESAFRSIVPFLITGAALVLAGQVRLRRWLYERRAMPSHRGIELGALGVASVYGGYFGAGLGIVLMAVLGLFTNDPLSRVNAVKQLLSIAVNICAAAFLVFSGTVEWTLVAVMAPGAVLGGNLGGRLISVIPAAPLRVGVVAYAFGVAMLYFVR
jgi:hypothetical protein